MRLDRTLNRDEVQEVVDALEEWKVAEGSLREYQRTFDNWKTSQTGYCNRSLHGTEGKEGGKG